MLNLGSSGAFIEMTFLCGSAVNHDADVDFVPTFIISDSLGSRCFLLFSGQLSRSHVLETSFQLRISWHVQHASVSYTAYFFLTIEDNDRESTGRWCQLTGGSPSVGLVTGGTASSLGADELP